MFAALIAMKRLEHCSLASNAIVIAEFLPIIALTSVRSLKLVSYYPDDPLTKIRDSAIIFT